jgi:hypothetical protein
MTRKTQLVRLVGACLCLLLGVVFCHQFSWFQLGAFVYGAGFEPEDLPLVCLWFARYSVVLLALPPLILWLGLSRLMRSAKISTAVEVLSQLALVTALALVVACIIAWQLPYMGPAG